MARQSLSVVAGSVAAVAAQSGKSVAETFLQAELVAIVDTSGSMATMDSRGGQSRYDVARQELQKLQAAHPGRVAVIAFSDRAEFCPGGVPTYYGAGTDLAGALRYAQIADGVVRFVVVSDGYPDDPNAALAVAGQMTSEIHTVYVGPESEDEGAKFLMQLARRKGGKYALAGKAVQLAERVETLLLAAG